MVFNSTVQISRSMAASGFGPPYFDLSISQYWSSTENGSSAAYGQDFNTGAIVSYPKSGLGYALPVRISTI